MGARRALVAIGIAIVVGSCGTSSKPRSTVKDAATDAASDAAIDPQAACTRNNPLRDVYFGDLHVHSALSLDANLQGTRVRPTDAYRFARGEEIDVPPYDAKGRAQRSLQLSRPLDFMAVTDHAEFLGLVTTCTTPGLDGYETAECKAYRSDPDNSFVSFNLHLTAEPDDAKQVPPCSKANRYCGAAELTSWNEIREAAAHADDRSAACSFTSFVGYEWSASPSTRNLHRNVIFADERVPALPFSYFDGSRETELWSALESDCLGADIGCDVLTIPHNSNLSSGLMFEPLDPRGKPFDAAYAKRRATMEPLLEIFQHKGSSECLPEMGSDEACNFELLPYKNLANVALGGAAQELVAGDFARDALGVGMQLGEKLGHNPFRYGFIGSTDSHLGIAGAVDEPSFVGHGGAGNPARSVLPKGLVDHAWLNPGGLTALWSEENSRPALFAAMRRREAYATSGPRITLRFFGGFGLSKTLCDSARFAELGYEQGVPMGGELSHKDAKGKTPRFALWALRDPGTKTQPGHSLSRAQIIKGWLEQGKVKYAVIDVVTPVDDGAEVDLKTCKAEGRGKAELCSTWSDPDFDPSVPAFYYARVLEVPSCRWHAYACAAAKVDCADPATITEGFEPCCDGRPATVSERAWSSPIFYVTH